jgi:hypothetical protein
MLVDVLQQWFFIVSFFYGGFCANKVYLNVTQSFVHSSDCLANVSNLKSLYWAKIFSLYKIQTSKVAYEPMRFDYRLLDTFRFSFCSWSTFLNDRS